ncbi:MAG: cellulase family glycosylhydrolase [Alistipes sp.]|nr:cellulase family glycosylhydrolase [Alistipes sp.]
MRSLLAIAIILLLGMSLSAPKRKSFVEVSRDNPHYLALSKSGEPYIPIGCNIAAVSSLEDMEYYLKKLHENSGNFGRVWLNSEGFEIETKYGQPDKEKLQRIKKMLDVADAYGIKLKLCIESFRHISAGENKWDTKATLHKSNGGPFNDTREYITTERGEEEFLRRVKLLKEYCGDHPAIFGWELWNEMNAVAAPTEDIKRWNERMLSRVKELFPKHMVMQSLGSLDSKHSFDIYQHTNSLPENEVSQVHRYLDEGAALEVCQAPMDILSADAIEVLRNIDNSKPLLLAESGAVKPNHAGPSELYPRDSLGTILHDVLFAPFFSGAAGPGHLWHWDHHIRKHNTWFQIGRFARAVEGINPIEEQFVPMRHDTEVLRVYTLRGEKTLIAWCRDVNSTWRSELKEGIAAEPIDGEKIDFTQAIGRKRVKRVEFYAPWKDEWTTLESNGIVALPEFVRSAVVKIGY